jgi:hypothetical protein
VPITVQDGAVTLKGFPGMGEGRVFFQKTSATLFLMTTYPMSLISAGSILLDSTLKWISEFIFSLLSIYATISVLRLIIF